MTYVVRPANEYPFFLRGEWVDFESKVPTLSGRSQVSSVFMDGKRPLSQDEVPETLKLLKDYKSVPDIFVTRSGALIVSQHMRSFINDLDPDQHQFFPVRITDSTDDTSRFIINVYVKQDSIIDEQSNVQSLSFKGFNRAIMSIAFHATREKGPLAAGQVDVAFDSGALSNLNLWRERRYPNALFVSDVFVEALQEQNLHFLDLRRGRDIQK
jgi:hypothetical protein